MTVKDTSINSKKLAVTGTVIVIGLTLALLIVGYYIFNTESKRDDGQPAQSSVPVEPEPQPVSPDATAPSSPDSATQAAPATAP
ncbi:MAG: hypothetical protein ABIR48_02825 [Gammaproteobacteria bacterium]